MSDLARQRRAREIWVSRSHLYALGVGIVLIAIACFALGYTAGRRSVDRYEPENHAVLADQPADDALVELLARVDAAATPDGGLRKLTFPDALAGQGEELELPEPTAEAPVVKLPADAPVQLEAPEQAPEGRWTIVVHELADPEQARAKVAELNSAGATAWLGVERLEGRTAYRVAVGGYGSRAEAEEVRKSLGPSFQDPEVARY